MLKTAGFAFAMVLAVVFFTQLSSPPTPETIHDGELFGVSGPRTSDILLHGEASDKIISYLVRNKSEGKITVKVFGKGCSCYAVEFKGGRSEISLAKGESATLTAVLETPNRPSSKRYTFKLKAVNGAGTDEQAYVAGSAQFRSYEISPSILVLKQNGESATQKLRVYLRHNSNPSDISIQVDHSGAMVESTVDGPLVVPSGVDGLKAVEWTITSRITSVGSTFATDFALRPRVSASTPRGEIFESPLPMRAVSDEQFHLSPKRLVITRANPLQRVILRSGDSIEAGVIKVASKVNGVSCSVQSVGSRKIHILEVELDGYGMSDTAFSGISVSLSISDNTNELGGPSVLLDLVELQGEF